MLQINSVLTLMLCVSIATAGDGHSTQVAAVHAVLTCCYYDNGLLGLSWLQTFCLKQFMFCSFLFLDFLTCGLFVLPLIVSSAVKQQQLLLLYLYFMRVIQMLEYVCFSVMKIPDKQLIRNRHIFRENTLHKLQFNLVEDGDDPNTKQKIISVSR